MGRAQGKARFCLKFKLTPGSALAWYRNMLFLVHAGWVRVCSRNCSYLISREEARLCDSLFVFFPCIFKRRIKRMYSILTSYWESRLCLLENTVNLATDLHWLVFKFPSCFSAWAERSSCVIGLLAKAWEIVYFSVQTQKCCSCTDWRCDKLKVKVSGSRGWRFRYGGTEYHPLLISRWLGIGEPLALGQVSTQASHLWSSELCQANFLSFLQWFDINVLLLHGNVREKVNLHQLIFETEKKVGHSSYQIFHYYH